jgi:hypothetical protein
LIQLTLNSIPPKRDQDGASAHPSRVEECSANTDVDANAMGARWRSGLQDGSVGQESRSNSPGDERSQPAISDALESKTIPRGTKTTVQKGGRLAYFDKHDICIGSEQIQDHSKPTPVTGSANTLAERLPTVTRQIFTKKFDEIMNKQYAELPEREQAVKLIQAVRPKQTVKPEQVMKLKQAIKPEKVEPEKAEPEQADSKQAEPEQAAQRQNPTEQEQGAWQQQQVLYPSGNKLQDKMLEETIGLSPQIEEGMTFLDSGEDTVDLKQELGFLYGENPSESVMNSPASIYPKALANSLFSSTPVEIISTNTIRYYFGAFLRGFEKPVRPGILRLKWSCVSQTLQDSP